MATQENLSKNLAKLEYLVVLYTLEGPLKKNQLSYLKFVNF